MKENILIIKLGALGDFVQAFAPFQAIRNYHPNAHITLLTTAPFLDIAKATSYFDDIQIDVRPKFYKISDLLKLRNFLISGNFNRIYDLQTSKRSSKYYHMMWPHKPEWSGVALGCSHFHDNPQRNNIHTLERQKEQLNIAGITDVAQADVAWLEDHTHPFLAMDKFVLLVPGGAPRRVDKRWPAESYAALACLLHQKGMIPVIIGTTSEAEDVKNILSVCPKALNLVGKTSIFDLASLSFKATAAIGNDTGPMHLAAIIGCPSLVLYSHASNPALCGQRGKSVDIIQVPALHTLSPEIVWDRLQKLLD